MARMRWMPLMCVAALAAAAQAWAIQVDLKYAVNSDSNQYMGGTKMLEFKTAPPAGQFKLPDPVGKFPLYSSFKLGDQEHLIMLDRKQADDKFYTRMRIDLNGNGDLNDDREIELTSNGDGNNYVQMSARNVEFKVKTGDKELPYCTSFNIACYDMGKFAGADLSTQDPREVMNTYVRSNCTYAGSFDLDGKKYDICLADNSMNGRFDDPAKNTNSARSSSSGRKILYSTADEVYLTAGAAPTYYDTQPYGDVLVIGDKAFKVKVDLAAGKMNLDPIQGDGTIQLPKDVKRLTMISEGNGAAMMFEPAAKVSLPAGQWRMMFYQLERKDAQGDTWRLVAYGNAEAPACKIDKGGSATCAFGEPFLPTVDVTTNSSSGMFGQSQQAQMQFVVLDSGKSQMMSLTHEGNNTKIALSTRSRSMPKEPSWQAVTAEGEKVASGSFEYG